MVKVTPKLFRNRADCECGWQSKSHLFRGGAVFEGGLHLATHSAKVEGPAIVSTGMKVAS